MPKKISKLRKIINTNKQLLIGLSIGVAVALPTGLYIHEKNKNSRTDSIKSENQILETKQTEAVPTVTEVIVPENPAPTTTTPSATPAKQTAQQPPVVDPSEESYKVSFVNTYNAVLDAANNLQEPIDPTQYALIINNQNVTFASVSLPASRGTSHAKLQEAIDILINNYLPNRRTTCSSGSSSSTQLLYQACMTKKSIANGAYSQYLSTSQLSYSYFQQGK